MCASMRECVYVCVSVCMCVCTCVCVCACVRACVLASRLEGNLIECFCKKQPPKTQVDTKTTQLNQKTDKRLSSPSMFSSSFTG